MKTISQSKKQAFDNFAISCAITSVPIDEYEIPFKCGFDAGAAFVQRWIPIKEELPEANDHSIDIEMKLENGVVLTGYRFTDGDWMAYDEDGFGRQVKKKVTHWRPIKYDL